MLGRSSASKALVKGVLGRFPAKPDAEVLTDVLRLPGSQPRRITMIVTDWAQTKAAVVFTAAFTPCRCCR